MLTLFVQPPKSMRAKTSNFFNKVFGGNSSIREKGVRPLPLDSRSSDTYIYVVGNLLPRRPPILQPLELLNLHRISIVRLTARPCTSGGIPVPAAARLVSKTIPTALRRNKEALPARHRRANVERLRRGRLCRCDRRLGLYGGRFEPAQSGRGAHTAVAVPAYASAVARTLTFYLYPRYTSAVSEAAPRLAVRAAKS